MIQKKPVEILIPPSLSFYVYIYIYIYTVFFLFPLCTRRTECILDKKQGFYSLNRVCVRMMLAVGGKQAQKKQQKH